MVSMTSTVSQKLLCKLRGCVVGVRDGGGVGNRGVMYSSIDDPVNATSHLSTLVSECLGKYFVGLLSGEDGHPLQDLNLVEDWRPAPEKLVGQEQLGYGAGHFVQGALTHCLGAALHNAPQERYRESAKAK